MSAIRKANDWSKIILQYSTDIKELELQVLLHGYKILKRSTVVSDNSLFTDMIRYDLKHI